MRWPLFWRPQIDEPLYHIRIVSWQVWNFSFFLNKENLMWHSNFRFHAQLLGDCGQLTSKDEGPTAVVIRCFFVVGEQKHRPCEVGAVYDCFCYLEESSKKADAWIWKTKTKKMRTLRNVGVSKNRSFSPQIIHFNRFFHYKPSILGYPYCTVQRLLGSPFQQVESSSWGLCLAAQWFGSSFWLCRDSRCLIHFVAWDWPNRLRVFFFCWECEVDRKNMKQTFWSRLSRHGICFAVSFVLKTPFFSGAYLILGMLQFHLFILWMGKDYQREEDSCPSQHSLPIHSKWSFELSGTHFAGKIYKDSLISGPKHLSEFKFTPDCRFKLLVQTVLFAETSLNHDQENTKTSFAFLFSPIFEAAN